MNANTNTICEWNYSNNSNNTNYSLLPGPAPSHGPPLSGFSRYGLLQPDPQYGSDWVSQGWPSYSRGSTRTGGTGGDETPSFRDPRTWALGARSPS